MGMPTAVAGDPVMGTCVSHLIPGPTGSPVPSPPLPFSAPLSSNTVASVLVEGKPAAVQGSNGLCAPPHVGLDPADPFMSPTTELGQVTTGSSTVFFGGQAAATAASMCTICDGVPGQLQASAATVLTG